jgi:hypothetical protein
MMVIFTGEVAPGVALSSVPYGAVVTRANAGDTVYLVASPMDGSGRKVLISLCGGKLKEVPQGTCVLVREATLTVGAIVNATPEEFDDV